MIGVEVPVSVLVLSPSPPSFPVPGLEGSPPVEGSPGFYIKTNKIKKKVKKYGKKKKKLQLIMKKQNLNFWRI